MSDIVETVRAMEDLARMGFCVVWTIMPSGLHRVAVGKDRQQVIYAADGTSLPEAFDQILPQVQGGHHESV